MKPSVEHTGSVAERLGTLAAGLCSDASVSIQVSQAPDARWSWEEYTRTIHIPARDLEDFGIDACAGVIAHEVGHAWISRYDPCATPFPSVIVMARALNSLEDPRVEHWMTLRYPGVASWLAMAHVATLRDQSAMDSVRLPAVMDLCGRFVGEFRNSGWLSPCWSAFVLEAAEATRHARERYVRDFLPPIFSPTAWEIAERAQAAIVHARSTIVPWLERAWYLDVTVIGEYLAQDLSRAHQAERALAAADARAVHRLIQAALHAAPRDHPAPAARPTGLRDRLGERLLETYFRQQEAAQRMASSSLDRLDAVRRATAQPELPARVAPHQRYRSAYDALYDSVAGMVQSLVDELERVLPSRRRQRARSGYASGSRLDLHQAYVADTDRRRLGEVWQRVELPVRRQAAFSLLVDLSSSMQHSKIDAAQRGTVLLAEVLDRLGIPFAINGFQDELIPVCTFGQGLVSDTRRVLAEFDLEVACERPDGHNRALWNDDGPCLLQAAGQLRDFPATDRFLVVISDGGPSGRHSDGDDLHKAVKTVTSWRPDVHLVAIGLGPGTEHVCDYYATGIANVELRHLPGLLGRLIRQAIAGGNCL